MTGRRGDGYRASVAVVVVDAEEAGLVSEAGDHCGPMADLAGRLVVTVVRTDHLGVTVVLIGRPDASEALIGGRGENRDREAPAAARCVVGRCQQSEVLCR